MKKIKILYVEDYPVIQDMYLDVLTKHGFAVDGVRDGKAALEKVKENNYDLILLDLLLPHVSGIEFLRSFHKENKQVKIIVLTDFDHPQTVNEVSKLDVDGYWMKVDNTPHMLAKRIENLFSS